MKTNVNYVSNNSTNQSAINPTCNPSAITLNSLAGAVETPSVPGGSGVTTGGPAVFMVLGMKAYVKRFEIYQSLVDCVDSMLFDSNTGIANLSVDLEDGHHVGIDLMVRGAVSVMYNGKTYHKPSEFPQELRDRIKAHPNAWEDIDIEKDVSDLSDDELVYLMDNFEEEADDEDSLYVSCNNWFEYIYTVTWKGEEVAWDGIMCEEDISKLTSDKLMELMKKVVCDVADLLANK